MHRWEVAVRLHLEYWGLSSFLEGDAAEIASYWFAGLARIDKAFTTAVNGLAGWIPSQVAHTCLLVYGIAIDGAVRQDDDRKHTPFTLVQPPSHLYLSFQRPHPLARPRCPCSTPSSTTSLPSMPQTQTPP